MVAASALGTVPLLAPLRIGMSQTKPHSTDMACCLSGMARSGSGWNLGMEVAGRCGSGWCWTCLKTCPMSQGLVCR